MRARRKAADDDGDGRRSPGAGSPEVAYLAGAHIGRADIADLVAAVLPDGPLYVHLDLDVTDPAGIPGLRYLASDGPDSTEVSRAHRTLLATGQVAAVGVACTRHPGQDAAAAVEPYLKSALAAGH